MGGNIFSAACLDFIPENQKVNENVNENNPCLSHKKMIIKYNQDNANILQVDPDLVHEVPDHHLNYHPQENLLTTDTQIFPSSTPLNNDGVAANCLLQQEVSPAMIASPRIPSSFSPMFNQQTPQQQQQQQIVSPRLMTLPNQQQQPITSQQTQMNNAMNNNNNNNRSSMVRLQSPSTQQLPSSICQQQQTSNSKRLIFSPTRAPCENHTTNMNAVLISNINLQNNSSNNQILSVINGNQNVTTPIVTNLTTNNNNNNNLIIHNHKGIPSFSSPFNAQHQQHKHYLFENEFSTQEFDEDEDEDDFQRDGLMEFDGQQQLASVNFTPHPSKHPNLLHLTSNNNNRNSDGGLPIFFHPHRQLAMRGVNDCIPFNHTMFPVISSYLSPDNNNETNNNNNIQSGEDLNNNINGFNNNHNNSSLSEFPANGVAVPSHAVHLRQPTLPQQHPHGSSLALHLINKEDREKLLSVSFPQHQNNFRVDAFHGDGTGVSSSTPTEWRRTTTASVLPNVERKNDL
eukprot:GDKJ01001169.1.p1 GENE.GDKJ01001169.1~~GDKJ01001169.1.p1  ORF type:complete len:514 (-),score=173.60 GDKJ01001169.1:60-1601(-)